MTDVTGSVPAWLADAIKSSSGLNRRKVLRNARPGDIVRLDSMDLAEGISHLGLIYATDDYLGVASIILLSPETEMQSEVDKLLKREQTNLPYDLLALTDLISHVWLVQLGTIITHIDLSIVEIAPKGLPLRDREDARWLWKEGALNDLQRLSSDCIKQLLAEPTIPVIDPAVLNDTDQEPAFLANEALRVVNLLRKHSAQLPIYQVGHSRSLVNWSGKAPDAASLIRSVIMKQPMSGVFIETDHQPSGAVEGRRLSESDPLLPVMAKLVAEGRTCVTVLSKEAFWFPEHTDSTEILGVYAAEVDNVRCQVVAMRLEEV